jgi:dTDP-4-dehydrorhamnose reductase
MSKSIIVLGANGMAGHVITTGLLEDINNYNVISVARSSSKIKPTVILDVSDFEGLKSLLDSTKPDIVINCIGLLNKTAEDNPDQAILINSYLPHFLESITKNTKTKVIHISTDCVFSGDEGSYFESSFKNGSGYYAQSKALGELNNSKDLTFRTSIIGPELNQNGIGLFHWFTNQDSEINGYTNAFWTGVTTIELLNAIKVAIENDLVGLYHLVHSEKISKFNLVCLFNDVFGTGLSIVPYDGYSVDKSLINTRSDFAFQVKGYKEMIIEMKKWIIDHKELYTHYNKVNS